MFFKTYSAGLIGIEGFIVEVETDIAKGLPQYGLVGLPDSAAKESKERVRSAIHNSGFRFPLGRITINLAPAHLRKIGPAFDLSVAVGMLCASDQIRLPSLDQTLMLGELSLDGEIKPVHGILPMALAAKENGFTQIITSPQNSAEASISGLKTYSLDKLQRISAVFGQQPIHADLSANSANTTHQFNFSEIIGQHHAKRALEIAAAGFHNVLMMGPPGTGKTLLATCLPSILPPLTEQEWLEIAKINSTCGKNAATPEFNRPFRSPHHSITPVGMIGGGTFIKPGEVTFAHHGVLFLDELCEFPRSLLELLRQPVEEHKIELRRNLFHVTFPTHFMLIGSMNPCPCGYHGFPDSIHICSCAAPSIEKYRKKISGPMMDRFDMKIEVPRLEVHSFLTHANKEEDSENIRQRVIEAVMIQKNRFGSGLRKNSDMTPFELKQFCRLTNKAQILLNRAYEQFELSHRSVHRLLKVARTIADLDKKEAISEIHIAEAVEFRADEKNFY